MRLVLVVTEAVAFVVAQADVAAEIVPVCAVGAIHELPLRLDLVAALEAAWTVGVVDWNLGFVPLVLAPRRLHRDYVYAFVADYHSH